MQRAGKTVIVTGGGSGLGAAAARMLAGTGAYVMLADVADAAALAEELCGAYLRTEVTSEADGRAAVNLAQSRFGALHGLVNCAGVVIGERVLGRDGPHRLGSFSRVIGVNLVGTFDMIRLAAAMRGNGPDAEGERGVIVNTASVAAYDGQIGQAAYAASKGGIVA